MSKQDYRRIEYPPMLHAVDSKELVFLGGFFAGDRPEEDGNAPTHAGAVNCQWEKQLWFQAESKLVSTERQSRGMRQSVPSWVRRS